MAVNGLNTTNELPAAGYYDRRKPDAGEPGDASGRDEKDPDDLFLRTDPSEQPGSAFRTLLAAIKKDIFLKGPYSFSTM